MAVILTRYFEAIIHAEQKSLQPLPGYHPCPSQTGMTWCIPTFIIDSHWLVKADINLFGNSEVFVCFQSEKRHLNNMEPRKLSIPLPKGPGKNERKRGLFKQWARIKRTSRVREAEGNVGNISASQARAEKHKRTQSGGRKAHQEEPSTSPTSLSVSADFTLLKYACRWQPQGERRR